MRALTDRCGGLTRVTSPDVPAPARAPLTVAAVAAELGVEAPVAGAQVLVSGLSLASGRVRPGDVFAAVPGIARHGAAFVGAAVAGGAVAVLTDPAGASAAAAAGVPVLVVADVREVLGGLAARLAGDPATALTVLAVTGTSGKTTTAHLLEAGLRAAGRRPGLIGTTGSRVDGHPLASALTTPEAPDLHRLLGVMVTAGADSVAMEVSSHALVLHRFGGLVADVALFTNLGHDHLDFHDGMEDYLAAKLRLFTPGLSRAAVVCVDDGPGGYGARVAAAARAAGLPTTTVTGRPGVTGADWSVTRSAPDAAAGGGSRFTVVTPDGRELAGRLSLSGAFNVSNAVLALAALVTVGVGETAALAGIGALGGVPGRLERVPATASPGPPAPAGSTGRPVAFVDYAHKPEALDAVLTELRRLVAPGGRLGVVLGAGGDRDRGKRPVMGELAGRLADLVVVTDDNPRGEDPADIRAAVLAGTRGTAATVVELGDRRAAIGHAVAALGTGDVLLVAGKGAETGQQVGAVTHPFDDRSVLADALAADVPAAQEPAAPRPATQGPAAPRPAAPRPAAPGPHA